jgi:hypothetical protein
LIYVLQVDIYVCSERGGHGHHVSKACTTVECVRMMAGCSGAPSIQQCWVELPWRAKCAGNIFPVASTLHHSNRGCRSHCPGGNMMLQATKTGGSLQLGCTWCQARLAEAII